MKNNYFVFNLIIIWLAVFNYGCNNVSNNKESTKQDSIKKDSLKKEQIKAQNSLNIDLRNLHVNKKLNLESRKQKVELLENVKLKDEVGFEYENTEYDSYYKSLKAERGNVFVIAKIKLSSEIKWSLDNHNFLPKISVIQIKPDSTLKRIGKMEYNLFLKPDRNYSCIEQIFKYEESAVFICHVEISKKVLDSKLFVCVDNWKKRYN